MALNHKFISERVLFGDVEELVEEHSEELSTEELQHLLAEQQRMAAEELSEEEGEDQQSVQQISSSEIKEILKKWTELKIFVEKTHPDREKANHCIHLLNDNVIKQLKEYYKLYCKQLAKVIREAKILQYKNKF